MSEFARIEVLKRLADLNRERNCQNAAINDLLARVTVERQGERRSARYRYINRGEEG